LPAPQVAVPHGAPDEDPAVAGLHDLILRSLDDDQAVEVTSIPLKGKTAIADHMVIASGRSTRQVASMAEKLLIDAQDVIVHLFRPEVRSFYNLEKMWAFDGDGAPIRPGAATAH
jgi:ribosome-associated protein